MSKEEKDESGNVTYQVWNPGAYSHVNGVLNRGEYITEKEAKKRKVEPKPQGIFLREYDPDSPGKREIWSLAKGTRKWVGESHPKHELGCADIFASMWPHLTVDEDRWDNQWEKEEKERYRIVEDRKVYYDRRMFFKGNLYFWEYDRGTMQWDQMADKINKYVSFAQSTKLKFTVLFSIADYRYFEYDEERNQKRIKDLLLLLQKKQTGSLFAVARHFDIAGDPFGESTDDARIIRNDVIGDPLGENFLLPTSTKFYSLLDLPNL